MAYVALTRMHLPFIEKSKEPGDKVTIKELADAKQGKEEIDALVRDGAMEKE